MMQTRPIHSLRTYHELTKHSIESVQSNRHGLDWPNQPLPFKIYTSLEPRVLPLKFERVSPGALNLSMLARLCYFSNGVTKVIRGMPFRAAACTGALYHIELYLICGDLEEGLNAGVYHFGAHDNALRQLRAGDFRGLLQDTAPAYIVLTSTWWRNAWKYQARAYRHAFWDGGTVLANMLAVAAGQHIPARVLVGFPDPAINQLLDVEPSTEAAIAMFAVGEPGSVAPPAPPMPALELPTRRLSAHQIDYPEIVDAHASSSLPDSQSVARWRAQFTPSAAAASGEPVEDVILRRGSSRRFSHAAVSLAQLNTLLQRATAPFAMDAFIACDIYLIVNAVEHVASGTYVFNRATRQVELLREGEFRRQAAHLDLGQELAGDAAFDAYWLVNLDDLDDRAYRAAQLSAAIEAGNLYLAAYAGGLGATGLTFFDDEVTNFFSPHAAGKSVMFLTAVGHTFKRGLGGGTHN